MEYVSPIDDRTAEPVPFAPRPSSLAGKRVALLDITKNRGSELLDRIEHHLRLSGARPSGSRKRSSRSRPRAR